MIRTLITLIVAVLLSPAWAQSLTSAQLTTLRNAITANPTWSAVPNDPDGHLALAQTLNAPASPTFSVWRTDCRVEDIYNAVNWAAYTPVDAVLGSDSGDTLHRKNGWLLSIQVKQMNLQIMTQGRATLNTAFVNVRAGLRDAVIQVPAGTGGANVSPGGASGVNVLAACVRNATEAEKVLATASQGSDTTGSTTARVMGWEGSLSADQVRLARIQ